jgi:hypothetical protein
MKTLINRMSRQSMPLCALVMATGCVEPMSSETVSEASNEERVGEYGGTIISAVLINPLQAALQPGTAVGTVSVSIVDVETGAEKVILSDAEIENTEEWGAGERQAFDIDVLIPRLNAHRMTELVLSFLPNTQGANVQVVRGAVDLGEDDGSADENPRLWAVRFSGCQWTDAMSAPIERDRDEGLNYCSPPLMDGRDSFTWKRQFIQCAACGNEARNLVPWASDSMGME